MIELYINHLIIDKKRAFDSQSKAINSVVDCCTHLLADKRGNFCLDAFENLSTLLRKPKKWLLSRLFKKYYSLRTKYYLLYTVILL